MNWSAFWAIAPPGFEQSFPGLYNGVQSPHNVAFTDLFYDPYFPPEISVAGGTSFTLGSAYLTACYDPLWRPGSGMDVVVRGYLLGQPVYDHTFTLTSSGPVLANFGSVVVDRVTFAMDNNQLVMDNLSVPEGGLTAAMLGMGLFLLAAIRRKSES